MFYNKTTCDVYIGTGAGTMLNKSIDKAKKSIWIVSPYLSPSLIEKLLAKQNEGVEVRLITSCDSMKHANSLVEDVLIERPVKKTTLKPMLEPTPKRQTSRHPQPLAKAVGYLAIAALLAGGALAFWGQYVWAGLALLGAVTFAWGKERLGKKNVETNTNNRPPSQPQEPSYKVAAYKPTPQLPFKMFRKNDKKKDYIHSKMYVIDDEEAFLGSLNFTYDGTKNNHETRIKLTEPAVVAKIKQEIESLYHSNREEVTIEELKKLA